jgi:diamine N-acetyltransferase
MPISIERCTLEHLTLLQEISFETFNETFKAQNSPENMKAYLERAFNSEKLEKVAYDVYSKIFSGHRC